MSAQSLLEQLLKSGLSALQGGVGGPLGGPSAAGRPGTAPVRSDTPAARDDNGFAWGTFGAGAVSGGALAMLLGHRRARGYAGKALKVGSVAALGALAYKAYTVWQAQQQAAGAPAASAAASVTARPGTVFEAGTPRRLDALPAPEVEDHSRAMLLAMMAAAKADGHLDERERELLEAELRRLEDDGPLRAWVEAELRRPLDPVEVARAARTPEMAAEMYLASVLVCDETHTMERLYLQELARELRLPPGLKAQLEAQVTAAA
jgi:uncharacterized membrane protein YebE (DUF533 family)